MMRNFLHIKNEGKPQCVLGVLDTPKGVAIEKEMREWLEPIYDLHIVYHDGSMFEYPALKYMQELCSKTGKLCLYLHTRGAVNTWRTTAPTHKMWKREFGEYRDEYLRIVNVSEPTVACPFTGKGKVTFYNGFIVNAAAMKEVLISPSDDRMVYEELFNGTPVNVVGRIFNNIERGCLKPIRKYLYEMYE